MKFYNPLVYFLDEDLQKSAQSMTTMDIDINIKHVSQILFDVIFYYSGIRSKKFYEYYFTKERKRESMEKWFPTFPNKMKSPSFSFYHSVESKWARKCLDHFMYLTDYLKFLLEEWYYRTNRDHELSRLLDFFQTIPLKMTLSTGLGIPWVGLKKIVIPWKNLAPKYRKRNIVDGYRYWYREQIYDPIGQYGDVPRDIPEWIFRKTDLIQETI